MAQDQINVLVTQLAHDGLRRQASRVASHLPRHVPVMCEVVQVSCMAWRVTKEHGHFDFALPFPLFSDLVQCAEHVLGQVIANRLLGASQLPATDTQPIVTRHCRLAWQPADAGPRI
jgi:hypothetical protein